MTFVLAAVLGVVIGISLGALGGGGSILTVPALVYALGQSPHSATTASLVIVGITAAAGAVSHARAGRVRWWAGTGFGVAGIAASYAGTALNRHMNPNALLLAFAVLMLVTAAAMLLRSRARTESTALEVPTQPLPATVPAAPREPSGGDGAPAPQRGGDGGPAAGGAEPASRLGAALLAKVVLAGLAVGFLTGFLGVGGGFIIVPALVMVLGYSMPVAVGTSLLVIAINSAAALAARVGHQTFHWSVIVPFTIAAIAGSLAGRRVAERVRPDTLTRSFSALLVAIAAYVIVRSLAG